MHLSCIEICSNDIHDSIADNNMKCYAQLHILLSSKLTTLMAMDQFNIAYRNKIDGFSVFYQFHLVCVLSSTFTKNHETQNWQSR